MKDLAAKYNNLIKHFCPKCGYYACQCEQIKRNKELAIQEEEREKARQIKNLGGLRAYEDFKKETFHNKKLLSCLSAFPKENFYLWGAAGTGKTHAATAVIRSFLPKARVVRASEISRELRACRDGVTERKIIEKFSKDIFVFDDLGSEKYTDFLNYALFEILDLRWQYKRGGLIITSNMSISALGAVIGDRSASRIAGLVGSRNTIEVSGQDYRLSEGE
ncbi:DNA replication protein DnaC [Elusimicrobium simillimum]|uniref:ATP-binding protein n=1 Tax=Elusimicrobium simillimum TaxID=3143438 RepID=UPI003C6F9C6A